MAKIDELKEKIATERELFKNLFILVIATLSGSFTILYKVAVKEADLVLLVLFVSSIIVSISLTIFVIKIYRKLNNLSEELRDA